MAKNQIPNSVKSNLLHLQKFEELSSAGIAAMEEHRGSGSAVPPPWQEGSGEASARSSPGCFTGNVRNKALPKLFS